MLVDAHFHLNRDLLKNMDLLFEALRKRIGKIWLLQLSPENNITDEEVMEVYKSYPDFVVPFGYMDFRKPSYRVDELYAKGFVGIKVIFPPKPYDHPSLFQHYQRAERYGMPIMFHTGSSGSAYADYARNGRLKGIDPMSTISKRMMPIALDTISKMFPDLVLVGAHLGIPWWEEAVWTADRHPNVYFEVSGYPLVNMNIMRRVFEYEEIWGVRTVNKLLFGTDFPAFGADPKKVYDYIDFWENHIINQQKLSAQDRELFFGKNAERIMGEVVKKRS